VQEISRLIDKEKVDLIVGLSASNELVAGVKPIVDAKIFFIGMNGGVAIMRVSNATHIISMHHFKMHN